MKIILTIFGDKRLDVRYQKVKQSMIEKQSIILRQLASDRNEEVALGRFLRNKAVKPELMIEDLTLTVRTPFLPNFEGYPLDFIDFCAFFEKTAVVRKCLFLWPNGGIFVPRHFYG